MNGSRWLLLFFLLLPWLAHGDTVDLLDHSSTIDLVPFVQYACLMPPAEEMPPSLDSLIYTGDHDRINLGFSDQACWFHVALHNLSPRMAHWAIHVDIPNADHIEALLQTSGTQQRIRWDVHPPLDLTWSKRHHYILIEAASDAQIDLWLKVRSRTYMSLGLNATSFEQTLAHVARTQAWNGGFYGIGATLFALHLLLWLTLPRRQRIGYQVYLGASWLYIAQQQSLLDPMLAVLGCPPSLADHLLIIISAYSGLLSLISLLELGAYAGLRRFSLVLAMTGLLLASLPLSPLPVVWVASPCIFYVTLCLLTCVGLCLWRIRAGQMQAWYALLAWTPISLLGLGQILIALGLIDHPPLTAALQWALIIQHFILSFLIVLHMRHITAQAASSDRRSRHAQAENEAKSTFLATISHEIRTPMNGVLGIIELLRDTPLSAQQKTYVSTIYNSGQTLLAIINDVLDYSKIQAGRLELESTHFELESLIHECVAIFTPQSREKKVPILIEFAEDTLTELRGDPLRLRQILLNLLSNALKFTDSGKITLKLRTVILNAHKVRLECSVQDTGRGISAEQIPHLFQYFRQADSSTTRRYGGSGLGLAICKQLTELMGGSIRVDSLPQQGACFHFNILLQIDPSRPQPATPTPRSPTGDAPRQVGRILLVEDNKVNQMVVLGMLRKMGLQAAVVENGLQAVSYVQAHPVQLILMDCEMPVMDGYEATRRIRRMEQDRQRPRCVILALTAHAMPYHRDNCLAAGMDDHLTKPITLEKLQHHLQQHLTSVIS